MALIKMPHPRIQVIKRSEGRSAVAAASYRSGEKLKDERLDLEFDYGRKQDILHTDILAPDHAPNWVHDRETLWNKAEANERRKDAQPAREFMGVLPRGLNQNQHLELVEKFAKAQFTSRGMVADIALHTADASDGGKNPHVHILLTMRELDGDGFASKKNREWNQRKVLKEWRSSWEEHINEALADSGSSDWVSFRSYKEQGINQEPTHHMGHEAWALETRYGIETRVGYENKKIEHHNEVRKMTDALGLGQKPPSRFAAALKKQAQSVMAELHHDQPETPEKQDHFKQIRKIAKATDFDKLRDPAKRIRYMAQIEAWEEAHQELLEAEANLGTLTSEENIQEGFRSKFANDNELGQKEQHNDERER